MVCQRFNQLKVHIPFIKSFWFSDVCVCLNLRHPYIEDYELALAEANRVGAALALSGVKTEALGIDPRMVGSSRAGEPDSTAPSLGKAVVQVDSPIRLTLG